MWHPPQLFQSVWNHFWRYSRYKGILESDLKRKRSNTFEVLSGQQNVAQVVVLDERADLRVDGGAIEAHHKQLAHLPAGA